MVTMRGSELFCSARRQYSITPNAVSLLTPTLLIYNKTHANTIGQVASLCMGVYSEKYL